MRYKYSTPRKIAISQEEREKLPRTRCREVWEAYVRHVLLPVLLPPRIVQDLDTIAFQPKKLPPNKGVFLFGKPHTGKTIEAAFLYVEWYYENVWKPASSKKKGQFITMSDFMQELKDSISNQNKSSQQVLDYFKDLDLLVLDDFGTDKLGDWAYQSLYYVVNYRYENLLPTIYTSNFSLPEIVEQLQDERLVKRIGVSCQIVEKKKIYAL